MKDCFDPWAGSVTRGGCRADEVISALQKCIRRGDAGLAARFAYELYRTSGELEELLWRRLSAISVEDVGFGAPMAPVVVDALDRLRQKFPPGSVDRPLFFVHAVRYLCACPKTRSSDLMKNIIQEELDRGILPEIPDVALDMHTRRGRELGRGEEFFYREASRVSPAAEDPEEPALRRQLLELLGIPEEK